MSIRTSSIANHARVVNFVRRFAAPAFLLAAQTGCGEKSAAPIDARCVNLPATSACPTATAPDASSLSTTIVVTRLDGIKDLVPTLNPTSIIINKATDLNFVFDRGTVFPAGLLYTVRLFDSNNQSCFPPIEGTSIAANNNIITVSSVTLTARPGKYTLNLTAYDPASKLSRSFHFDLELTAAASGAQPTSTSTVRPPVPTSTGAKAPSFCDKNPTDPKCNF